MKIREYLQWQDDTDLDAFITRLSDDEERVRQNVRNYVVSDMVKARLDAMMKSVGERLDDNRDVGRYIHGAFGSGKSNLLTVLGKMLERDEMVYDLGHPAIRELRSKHGWLDRHRTLVVRINMMTEQSLTQALFEGYNRSLPPGLPRLSFTDEDRVFELIEKDAQRLGGLPLLLEQAANDAAFLDIPEMPRGMPAPLFVELYQRLRKGDRDKRLALAAALHNWRNHGASPIRAADLWVDARTGLDRIARHAKEHGYTAIAWLIDELVIWIRGRTRAAYVNEINHLSALVDHDAARVIPFFVAVAVQMDIARTCPEDLSQRDFQEQLGFVRDRFQPQLELEDQDLYEVAAQRVLARRHELTAADRKTFEETIDAAFAKHRDTITTLSGGLPPGLVRRLYPFNPALLRILVDVTQALSRNRTAIAALYRLLNRNSDIEVGQFIPVGALWDFVFEPESVSYVKANTTSKLCQRLADTYETWLRLEPKLDTVAGTTGATRHQLQQVVRTVLLCQLSDRPYFTDNTSLGERVTASLLLHLNETDIRALIPRTGVTKVAAWFRELTGVAPWVQVTGDSDPKVSIKIEQLDIERVLNTARAQVGHPHRFAFMRKLLIDELGLDLGTSNEGAFDVLWRGTRRRGRVKLANVRNLSYAGQVNDFDPGKDEFLILIDYPFDEDPSRSRQDDLDNCQKARARTATWSLAWLPEHLSPAELEALTNAAAVDVVRQDPRTAFADLKPREADAAARMLEGYQQDRRRTLAEAVRRLFFEQGLIAGMKAALDGIDPKNLEPSSALERLAKTLLDKRYPNHPPFTRRVTGAELGVVVDWVVRAAKTGATHDLKSAEMPLVDAILLPLEVAHRAPSGITRRTDGRYLASIENWIGKKQLFEAQDLRTALMADSDGPEKWGFGLTKEVANFFLYYLLHVAGFEAQSGDRSDTIHALSDIKERFRLVKEDVVDAPAWDKARGVALKLFELKGIAELPNPPEQAKLCRDAGKKAAELRAVLTDLERDLRQVCTWAGVDPDASARVRTTTEFGTWLDGLIADLGPASRTRRLADLSGKPSLETYVKLRGSLADEKAAQSRIALQKEAFQYLEEFGTDEDKTTVVLRLRNLLKDDVSTTLLSNANGAETWATETKRRYALHAGDAARRKLEQAKALEEAKKKTEEEKKRALQAEQKQREAEALAEAAKKAAEASAAALAEQKRREAEEGARSKVVTGSRTSVAKAAQEAVTELVRAHPSKNARFRVRVVLEAVEEETS